MKYIGKPKIIFISTDLYEGWHACPVIFTTGRGLDIGWGDPLYLKSVEWCKEHNSKMGYMGYNTPVNIALGKGSICLKN